MKNTNESEQKLNTGFVVLLLMFLTIGLLLIVKNDRVLSEVLGISTSKNIPTITVAPTDSPTWTAEPTNTPTPIPQWPAYQAPAKINCNVTAYVPNYQPVYEQFTPQQCLYEQQYAVTLWDRTVGAQQNTQLQLPQSIPYYPSGNSYVPPPPAINGQPVLQQPAAPNGSLNYQPPVAPTSSCHWVCSSDSNCMQICN